MKPLVICIPDWINYEFILALVFFFLHFAKAFKLPEIVQLSPVLVDIVAMDNKPLPPF